MSSKQTGAQNDASKQETTGQGQQEGQQGSTPPPASEVEKQSDQGGRRADALERGYEDAKVATAPPATAAAVLAASGRTPSPATSSALSDITNMAAADIAAMFSGFVNDVTDPEFLKIIRETVSDLGSLAAMHLRGDDPSIISEATTALKARGEAILAIPGLIAAGRIYDFKAFWDRLLQGLLSLGIAALHSVLKV